MNIHIPPSLQLESVRTVQNQLPGEQSYLFRISTSDPAEPLLELLRYHHQHDTLPEDHPGVKNISISEETTAGSAGYSITVAVKPPPGFTELDDAFRYLDRSWQTAETEHASLDSQQTVIHSFQVAMHTLNQFIDDVANAPAFVDTPEGMTAMFEYIHEQIDLAQQQSPPEPDGDARND